MSTVIMQSVNTAIRGSWLQNKDESTLNGLDVYENASELIHAQIANLKAKHGVQVYENALELMSVKFIQHIKWLYAVKISSPWYYRVIRRNQFSKTYPIPGNLLPADINAVKWTMRDFELWTKDGSMCMKIYHNGSDKLA
jgi:hypothetical protein